MTRDTLDRYYTPQPVADAIVDRLWDDRVVIDPRVIVEPSAGKGAFVTAVRCRAPGAEIVGIDVDLDVATEHMWHHRDFLEATFTGHTEIDLIIGNPPYSDAEAHVRKALEIVRSGGVVAFLLRLAFLESAKRAALWAETPPDLVYVMTERPSFVGGKTDSSAYGVFVWKKGSARQPRIRWISWR